MLKNIFQRTQAHVGAQYMHLHKYFPLKIV